MAQQIWAVNSLGGFLHSDPFSKVIRHSAQPIMKFRQFVDAEPAIGKNRGDAVLFDKISNISTAGGSLNETATIPKNNYTITQGTLTVTEYGNSIPFTLKAQTLAEVQVPEIVRTVLRNDMAKVLDSAAAVEFQTSDLFAIAINTATTSFDSSGAVSSTATADMSDKNARDVIDELKKKLVPKYDGQNYVCIASTNSIRGLYDFFEAKAQNTTMAPLFSGEIGQYYGCRFIEETNRLINTAGSGSVFGEAVFFGADAVREGVVIPEEIRIDMPKDFGRDQAVAWYYLGGFVKTWDFSGDAEGHIIYLTSA
jgi:N4-gp56 family major capsid protein|tara:strand:- start:1078 stop:2007 length:930 start_codon:yes stop_codon:yes gene_type:complete